MDNLLQKARAGRTNALAALTANLGDTSSPLGSGARFRNTAPTSSVTFISKRPSASATHWI